MNILISNFDNIFYHKEIKKLFQVRRAIIRGNNIYVISCYHKHYNRCLNEVFTTIISEKYLTKCCVRITEDNYQDFLEFDDDGYKVKDI